MNRAHVQGKGMRGTMRQGKRVAALLLGIVLAAAASADSVFAASGLVGLRSESVELNDQLTLVKNINYNTVIDDNAVEHYLAYTPGGNILPLVAYGDSIRGAASAASIIAAQAENGMPVLGLANGDFFVMSTGVSLGPVVRDGIVRSGGYSESVIAFREDGSAHIGDPQLDISLSFPQRDSVFHKVNFNKSISEQGGVTVLTEDFGETSGSALHTYNVFVRIEEGVPRVGETVRGVVEMGFESSAKVPLQEGYFVLSIVMDTPYASTLQLLQDLHEWESVELRFDVAEEFLDTQQALGFERWLIRDGAIIEDLDYSSRAPRTAFGIKEDGSCILYTVDGRQKGYSMGLTIAGLAQRLEELGCVQAVNLDGGASTQLFAVYPGYEKENQINVDSDAKSLRSCANYLCFINTNERDGVPARLHLYPFDEYVLTGTSLPLYAKATDGGYFACDVPEAVVYTCDEMGSIEEDVYRAGSVGGTGIIFASSGRISGSMRVFIIEDPDSITPQVDGRAVSILTAGIDRSYQLSAKAVYRGQTLRSDVGSYSWSVEGDIGSIDENGVFTASGVHEASGTIVVKAGNVMQTIEVTLQQSMPSDPLQLWIREIAERVENPQSAQDSQDADSAENADEGVDESAQEAEGNTETTENTDSEE